MRFLESRAVRLALLVVSTSLLCLLGTSSSFADETTYAYTGAPFITCWDFSTSNCSQYYISGQITLAEPLIADDSSTQLVDPISFSFTDQDPAHPQFTNLTAIGTTYFYIYSTDASGLPTSWSFFINAAQYSCTSGFQISSYATSPFDCSGDTYYGYEGQSDAPGTWTDPSPSVGTPEPSSLMLLGSGLLPIGIYFRRRRSA